MPALTGPAMAIDSGMNASDTKKSRLDTRPSMCGGTRRCSSVPQMTIGAEKQTPTTKTAAAITQTSVAMPTTHERQAADAPEQVHDRQVPPRHPERRHAQRADRAADAERGHHDRVLGRATAGAVLDHERDQHLDRAHDQQDQHRGEQQGGEQPRRAHHVDEAVAQVDQRRRGPGAPARPSGSRRSGTDRTPQQERDAGQLRPATTAIAAAGDEAAIIALATRRPGRLHDGRAQHALDAVGRHQVVGGQDRRQQRRVGRVGEAVADADHAARPATRCHSVQQVGEREHRHHADRDRARRRPPSAGSAAAGPGRRARRRAGWWPACRRPRRRTPNDSSVGPPPIAMTCQTSAISQTPAANSDIVTAPASSRYCPERNGRSGPRSQPGPDTSVLITPPRISCHYDPRDRQKSSR